MPTRAATPPVRSRRTRVRISIIAAALAAASTTAPAPAPAAGPRLDAGERALLRAVNDRRAAHGLPGLRPNRPLARAADGHCRDMLRAGRLAHASSDGTSMERRVRRHRPSRRLGETLAYLSGRGGRRAASRVVSAWMNSSQHRALLLSSDFRRVGIARRRGRLAGTRGAVYTMDLASRR